MKLVIMSLLLCGGIASAEVKPEFELSFCDSFGDCEIHYQGDFDEYPIEVKTSQRRKKVVGSGYDGFVQTVALGANKAIGQVSDALGTARDAAWNAGLSSFEGTLNFRDGSAVSFNYHFGSGRWSVSGGGDPLGKKIDQLSKVKSNDKGHN